MDFNQGPSSTTGPKTNILPNAIFQDVHENWSALHDAAAAGEDKKLQMLLEMYSERAIRESCHGNTPLHEAATRGYSRCVKLLCTPRITEHDSKGKKWKGLKTKQMLGTTIFDIQNNGGFTALHLAAQNGHNQSCRELLLAGADPNIKNNYGDTPLHTSCRYGHAGATRILISADCDVNIVNLNGDHPLHISCAMGRRKLTRLLLEADSDMNIKNSQNETPRDIAIRKKYMEILDILNNPQRMRNRHEKKKQHQNKQPVSDATRFNGISWSPYGCHYFPDPRSFPAPKLETLPKEPLKRGEQYYLDLAGHIRKGPIGVGNTCYCGPFFKHIEHKINCNRKSLRMYVNKTKETLDNKVRALAIRTNDQIEQLTRSVIADRVRCESRRLQLNRLIKRGDPLRSTTDYQQFAVRKQADIPNLVRSRSMELFDRGSEPSSGMSNSKSCGGLLDEAFIMSRDLYRLSINTDDHKEVACKPTEVRFSTDILNRHSNEVFESNTNLQIKPAQKWETISPNVNHDILEHEKTGADCANNLPTQIQNFRDKSQLNEIHQNRYENIDNVVDRIYDIHSINSHTHITPICEDEGFAHFSNKLCNVLPAVDIDKEISKPQTVNAQDKACPDLKYNEYSLQRVLHALRKQRSPILNQNESLKTNNESEMLDREKLSYKDAFTFLTNGLGPKRAEKSETDMPTKHLPPTAYNQEDPTSKIEANQLGYAGVIISDPRVSSFIEKVEIKNSEIKSLKKPMDIDTATKRNRVQELVARLQGKLSATSLPTSYKQRQSSERRASLSESSEDEQNNHNELKITMQSCASPLPSDYINDDASKRSKTTKPIPKIAEAISEKVCYNAPIASPIQPSSDLHSRIIPKDAYFHQLPDKKRKPITTQLFLNDHILLNPTFTVEHANQIKQKSVTSAMYNFALDDQFPACPVINSAAFNSNDISIRNSKTAFNRNAYKTTQALHNPPDNYVQYVERDISNDSGVSTHFNCAMQWPSPSLSPQTFYPSESQQSLKSFPYSNYSVLPLPNNQLMYTETGRDVDSAADFPIGNISSLV